MCRFLIIIEKANGNCLSYSPDLSGCVATGSTREEVEKNVYETIIMYREGLAEDGVPVPVSEAFSECLVIREPITA